MWVWVGGCMSIHSHKSTLKATLILSQLEITDFCCLDDIQSGLDCFLGIDENIQRRSSALFILKLKEFRRVWQNTIDGIVEEWTSLFKSTLSQLEAGVKATLANSSIDVQTMQGLHDLFLNVPNTFMGLKTCYKQEKYFCDHLGLVVSFN